MHKGSIIISRVLYFYLLPNYCVCKGKVKRVVSYIKASKALPGSSFIAVVFSVLEPHFTYSRW